MHYIIIINVSVVAAIVQALLLYNHCFNTVVQRQWEGRHVSIVYIPTGYRHIYSESLITDLPYIVEDLATAIQSVCREK
jgi:hypothetical protein